MESQSGLPQDLENMDFDKEVVTFSLLPDPPATPTATLAATVPKMLFIYPRLLGRIQVPGVAPITKNTKDTQDPQHAGDPSAVSELRESPTRNSKWSPNGASK